MAATNPYQTELPIVEFSNTLELLLAQSDSALRGAVSSKGGYRGRIAQPVNYIAPMRFSLAGNRGDTLVSQYAQYQSRWVSPVSYEFSVMTDEFDQLRGLIDPKSAIVQVMRDAVNVLYDDAIIPGFFAAATIGPEAAQTTETFNSGANFPQSVVVAQDFGIGADHGVSIAKILEGKRILSKYENNLDRMVVHMGMTSQGENDLLKSAEFVSTDFRNQAVYDEIGRVKMFKGVMFHYSERWQYASGDTTERLLPMWTEDGMHLAIWEDVQPNISQETNIVGQPWHLYAKVTMGVTRLQAGKVVRISATDATGGAVTI